MRELLNRAGEQWALLRRADQANTRLAIFVHGFRGNYLSTWGILPHLLYDHADANEQFASWDFLFIGYETGAVDTYLDIANLIFSHWRLASAGDRPHTQAYAKLALFGHSLGTLAIRQALCAWSEQPDGLLESLHSVTLFGSPMNGSPLAIAALGIPIGRALRPNNPQLRMLRCWVEGAHKSRPWPTVSVIVGQDDHVVGFRNVGLVAWPGDGQRETTPFDHSELVKPVDWKASAVVDYVARGLK